LKIYKRKVDRKLSRKPWRRRGRRLLVRRKKAGHLRKVKVRQEMLEGIKVSKGEELDEGNIGDGMLIFAYSVSIILSAPLYPNVLHDRPDFGTTTDT